MVSDHLDVDSVGDDLAILLKLMVDWLGVLSETELDAGSNLLAAGELEHRSSEGLLCVDDVGGGGSDGHQD